MRRGVIAKKLLAQFNDGILNRQELFCRFVLLSIATRGINRTIVNVGPSSTSETCWRFTVEVDWIKHHVEVGAFHVPGEAANFLSIFTECEDDVECSPDNGTQCINCKEFHAETLRRGITLFS